MNKDQNVQNDPRNSKSIRKIGPSFGFLEKFDHTVESEHTIDS